MADPQQQQQQQQQQQLEAHIARAVDERLTQQDAEMVELKNQMKVRAQRGVRAEPGAASSR